MELQVIQNKIYEIRGERVMLDRDLAELYNVPTKTLNQAVKRNLERFPEDFMFQLNESEFANLRSQIVTSRWGGTRTTNPNLNGYNASGFADTEVCRAALLSE